MGLLTNRLGPKIILVGGNSSYEHQAESLYCLDIDVEAAGTFKLMNFVYLFNLNLILTLNEIELSSSGLISSPNLSSEFGFDFERFFILFYFILFYFILFFQFYFYLFKTNLFFIYIIRCLKYCMENINDASLLKTIRDNWLMLDSNKDGVVTREEFITYLSADLGNLNEKQIKKLQHSFQVQAKENVGFFDLVNLTLASEGLNLIEVPEWAVIAPPVDFGIEDWEKRYADEERLLEQKLRIVCYFVFLI